MNPEQQITPDEILFELLDIGALLFPQYPDDFTFDFIPTEDGQHPALHNLAGNPYVRDGQQIPVLSEWFTEQELFDRINSYLQALSASTERQLEKRIVTGSLMVQPIDADGGQEVWFVDRDPDGARGSTQEGVVRLKRRFDKSERQMLFFTPEFFRSWNMFSADVKKFESESAQWLSQFPNMNIDPDRRSLVSDGTVIGNLKLGATFHRNSQTMMWGFAHDNLPRENRIVPATTGYFAAPGLRLFQQPELIVSEPLAIRLLQMRVVQAGNIDAVIRITHDGEHGLLDFMWLVESTI